LKSKYHREITSAALSAYFQAEALEAVIDANLGQDALPYQVGHDHFHYDNNAFAAGDAYYLEQRRQAIRAAQNGEAPATRRCLGRLTHTVQDFYAHSNYIHLWRESHPNAAVDEIDPQAAGILSDPRLCSGKIYYPLEAFSYITAVKPFVLPFLPHDSHAWMNLDDPSRPGFELAIAAALKRTRAEYLSLVGQLSAAEAALLTGYEN
jgi:hypothetical protein